MTRTCTSEDSNTFAGSGVDSSVTRVCLWCDSPELCVSLVNRQVVPLQYRQTTCTVTKIGHTRMTSLFLFKTFSKIHTSKFIILINLSVID